MPTTKSKRIVLAVINDLAGDQRVHRIATSLSEAGNQVTVVGRLLPHSKPLSPRSYLTHRFRLPIHQGKWFYLIFNLRLFAWLLGQRADIITANDLDTLLACTAAARLKRCSLIYDSHELFTEVPELIHRPATRKIWLWLEQWLVPKLRTAYTVNESLAKIFTEKYKVPFVAIRNVPFAKPMPSPPKPGRVIIYQGALNLGRGIDLMIDAMALLEGFELRIIGRGDVEEDLRKRAASLPAGRVTFYGFMPLEKLAAITAEASLGLSLEEDLGANYHFASPNKVYDYIQAGIPVLVSDLPEMRSLVESTGCGEILRKEERNTQQLAARIAQICAPDGPWQSYADASANAAKIYIWELEKQKLLALYA
ncbi:MAG: glycosyltransferase [Bacteroidia bacterium]|nr:glycosyltransferase [Bacteroidia bacterium]